MTNDQARCAACYALLPVAKSSAAMWISGVTATGIGLAATKSWWGRLLIAAAGFAGGYVVDEIARPVCGSCGVRA